MAVRLLLVEDDESIIEFVSLGLSYEGFELAVARSGTQAIETLQAGLPDIVVLDLGLPGRPGFDVLDYLRRRGDTPVVILSARHEVAEKVAGLEAGADDYLAKPFRFEELLARIRAVLRRRGPSGSDVLRVAGLTVDVAGRTVSCAGRPVELTAKEFDLLEAFMVNAGRVLTRDVLLTRVWGYDWAGDSNLIETHVSNLRKKLPEPCRGLIRTVRGVGYVLRADP